MADVTITVDGKKVVRRLVGIIEELSFTTGQQNLRAFDRGMPGHHLRGRWGAAQAIPEFFTPQ